MSEEFKWREGYSVSVKEIDDQHKKLVELITRLFAAAGKVEDEKEIKNIIEALIEYAKYHFDTEEKYFKAFKYEHEKEHIAEHQAFAEKVVEFKKEYQKNPMTVKFELVNFLEDWFVDHVTGSDRKYIKCFVKNGLK